MERKPLRLKEYDYAQPGAYFVTVVTQGRECRFGEIINGEIHANPAGQMIAKWWNELPHKYPDIELDTFCIMPNHFHGIIMVDEINMTIPYPIASVGADLRVRPGSEMTPGAQGAHVGAPLPEMMQWFKTMTTNAYIRGVKQLGWKPFDGKLWQRSYYDHVIRNDGDLTRIRSYIQDNPRRWAEDHENPEVQSSADSPTR